MVMGQLKPDATYIYERHDGITYAREMGADPATRKAIGWDYKDSRTNDGRPLHDHIQEDQLWGEIRRKAQTHPGLAAELERVIIYYRLLEDDDNTVMHHPV
jgi:hypothetical protein